GGPDRSSAGGPLELSTPEEVEVEVVDRLARVRPDVHDEAVPPLVDTLLARDIVGQLDERREDGATFRPDPARVRNMDAGDDECVQRRARLDVPEGDRVVTAAEDRGRDVAGDDRAEEAIGR